MGICIPYYRSSKVDLLLKNCQFLLMALYIHMWSRLFTSSVYSLESISTLNEVETCSFYIYKEIVYQLSIFSTSNLSIVYLKDNATTGEVIT
jgi:hypothetical protein